MTRQRFLRIVAEGLLLLLCVTDVMLASYRADFGTTAAAASCLMVAFRFKWPATTSIMLLPAVFCGYALIAPLLTVYALAQAARLGPRLVVVSSLHLLALLAAAWGTGDGGWGTARIVVDCVFTSLLVGLPVVLGMLQSGAGRTAAPVPGQAVVDQAVVEQAVLEERRRLAREMHDVVGHGVSLIALRASLLTRRDDASAIRTESDSIYRIATRTLDEMREAIRPLHHDAATPSCLAAEIRDAVAGHSNVSLATTGDLKTLSPHSARIVLRVVQEGLTNIHRHAPGSDGQVTIRVKDCTAHVSITNGPPADTESLLPSGAGTGLTGLSGRVEEVGGKLEYGRTDTGGFTLHAVVPGGCADAAA